MRTCTKCKIEKPDTEFYVKKSHKAYSWCKGCCREAQRQLNIKNKDKIAEYRQKNRERRNAQRAARGRTLRLQAIKAYGGKCVCCGESETAFLVFDHVNDDGAEHRKEVSSAHMPWWLARNNYPDSIQLLCANCNTAKQWSPGGCPHGVRGHTP